MLRVNSYVQYHWNATITFDFVIGGKGRVRNNQKLTTIMDFNSDAGSVCSSESFSSTDGGVLSSISPVSHFVISHQNKFKQHHTYDLILFYLFIY